MVIDMAIDMVIIQKRSLDDTYVMRLVRSPEKSLKVLLVSSLTLDYSRSSSSSPPILHF